MNHERQVEQMWWYWFDFDFYLLPQVVEKPATGPRGRCGKEQLVLSLRYRFSRYGKCVKILFCFCGAIGLAGIGGKKSLPKRSVRNIILQSDVDTP